MKKGEAFGASPFFFWRMTGADADVLALSPTPLPRAGAGSNNAGIVGQNLYVAARKNTSGLGRSVVFDVDSTVPSDALIVIVDSDFSGM